MALNENIINIFNKLLNSKKKSKKILYYIKKLENKGLIDSNISLFLIKSIIIICSYYPNRKKFVCNLLKNLYKSNSDAKTDLLKKINKFNIEYYEDNILDDYLMDNVLFETTELLYNCSKLNNILPITIFNEIILSCSKIKSENELLKVKIYLMFVKKSNKVILDSLNMEKPNGQVYLKIMELCGVTAKLINNFLNN
jgi:hypothetical protein